MTIRLQSMPLCCGLTGRRNMSDLTTGPKHVHRRRKLAGQCDHRLTDRESTGQLKMRCLSTGPRDTHGHSRRRVAVHPRRTGAERTTLGHRLLDPKAARRPSQHVAPCVGTRRRRRRDDLTRGLDDRRPYLMSPVLTQRRMVHVQRRSSLMTTPSRRTGSLRIQRRSTEPTVRHCGIIFTYEDMHVHNHVTPNVTAPRNIQLL